MKMHRLFQSFLVLLVMTSVVLGLAAPRAAQAQITSFAIAGDNTPDPNIFFTGGVGGVLVINIPKGFILSKVGLGVDNDVRIVFSRLPGIGASGYNFNAATGEFSQILKGGKFEIVDNATGKLLLAGQFREVVLHGTNGSSSLALTLLRNSVVYDGTTPFFPGGSIDGGTFSIEFIATDKVVADPSGVKSFKANDGMSFGVLGL